MLFTPTAIVHAGGAPFFAYVAAGYEAAGITPEVAQVESSVGRRIRRIRWLLEGPLHRRAHRDVQIDALGRDRLGEPFVVERRKLGALIEVCGRGIGNSF